MIASTVNIIGVGGIGSWVASTVARMGVQRLVLYDDDIVESHNLENQNYNRRQIGKPKVKATALHLRGIREWHADHGRKMQIIAREERVGINSRLTGVVVVAVDSAQARREIFSICRYNIGVPLYIEAGAAENKGVVRVLVPHDPDHVAIYEDLLEAYSDDGPAPCVTPFMAGQFASIIGSWLQKFSNGWRPLVPLASRIYYVDQPTVDTDPML